jgi:hypothetical protein
MPCALRVRHVRLGERRDNHSTVEKNPRIIMMGEDVTHEYHGTGAIDLDHHMQPVRLSIEAINQASRIIPPEVWKVRGLCTWLQGAAEHYFALVPSDKLDYLDVRSTIRYIYEFDANGPVLKGVRIG